MKKNALVTAAMILGTLGLTVTMVSASTATIPGPVSFTSLDADNDGAVTEQEFNTFREQRQAAMRTSGRMGKNRAAAPAFSRIDLDGDGLISLEEFTTRQQSIRGKHAAGMHHGAGQTYNNRGMGMERGHHGKGQWMTGKMASNYQNLDTEAKEKHDAFFAATTELRKEIAIKRAEKQAIMHSVNPDSDQAALLTRELLELRAQMHAQAEEAGVQIAQGHSNRHGGMGHGGGARW